ncbi:non-hydrolyzing UDP-N-acetylglucosamine 2-epimerase [Microbacterium sp. A84]|uniref:non-hydrolyzing UDP-N-acetylglucosamine 2-epimerase n=1 Tax=Microbacterium sp. A84 TaxID=3450715 RepID=UPI003F43BDCC
MKKIAVVYGTRPEAIKVAPVIHELKRRTDLETIVVSTGQHREMLQSVESIFDVKPDVRLSVMKPRQQLTALFGRVSRAMDDFLIDERPDILLVHGDTTTAAASALAAYHRETPVAHLEAGLRSGEFWRPFPEEGNRKLITRMAQVHLAPTPRAQQNLIDEAVPANEITVTGNTVIDALHWAAVRSDAAAWPAELAHLDDLPATDRVLLVTLHRRENQASAIGAISEALAQFARANTDIRIVFPMHRNPVVRDAVRNALANLSNVDLIDPVDYLIMVKLLKRSWVIVTDSGGIQEEAPAFGVPVLVARDSTERPEAIDAGVARLVGGDGTALLIQLHALNDDPAAWSAMAHAVSPFGDGLASGRVVTAIREHLGIAAPLMDLHSSLQPR